MATADVMMRPLKKIKLGPPDCYPQDPKQPEVISQPISYVRVFKLLTRAGQDHEF